MHYSSNMAKSSRLTLDQKGFLLMVLPMILQAGLFFIFLSFRNDADRLKIQSDESSAISTSVRDLACRYTTIILQVDDALDDKLVLNPSCNVELKRLFEKADSLRTLFISAKNRFLIDKLAFKTASLVNAVREEAAIWRSKSLLRHWQRLMTSRRQNEQNALALAGNYSHESDDLAKTDPDFVSYITGLKNDLLSLAFSLAKTEGNMAVETPEQKRGDEFVIVAAVCAFVLNLIALLLLTAYTGSDIIVRLNVLNKNTIRLSRGQKLLPAIEGEDKIAELDRAFHGMAVTVTERMQKEEALFENAHDVLCYIDESHRFSGINKAAVQVLGYGPNDLIGIRVEEVVIKEDRVRAINQMSTMISGGKQARFEIRIKRGDGKVIHTLWSGRYVPGEAKIFCVIHDISKQKAAELFRKGVIQMVTQDLRHPLSTINFINARLASTAFGQLNETGKQQLQNAQANTDRMLGMIGDLLDIEKLDRGSFRLDLSLISLPDVVEESIESVLFLARAKRIKIGHICPDLKVYADRNRIVRVLVNLLSNAIKFSPANGYITLSAKRLKGGVEISVRDQGRGIPAEMMKVIFDRFKQVESSDATIKGGSGLGLAICKALVELHGGWIAVESQEGKGSRFYFFIPS